MRIAAGRTILWFIRRLFMLSSLAGNGIKASHSFQRQPSCSPLMQRLYGLLLTLFVLTLTIGAQSKPRARDLGIAPGVLATGPLNAITDVDGVRVGHTTVIAGDDVRTGVTAV